MSILTLEHVAAGYYDSHPILRDVSFTLERGQQVTVLGGNGEGKTTLLKVAAGLLQPSKGQCSYFGTANPAFIYQVPAQQLICATVREEIQFTLRLNGSDESYVGERTHELLEVFQLTALATRAPRTLSGGQQQRLALAATLCRTPELMLLDEPDVYLDGACRREFREFFKDHVRAAAIWTVCRESEIPDGMIVLRLENGVLS